MLTLICTLASTFWPAGCVSARAWLVCLSVDDLALLTYRLGVAPRPGMGALDRHQVSTPTDVPEPPYYVRF